MQRLRGRRNPLEASLPNSAAGHRGYVREEARDDEELVASQLATLSALGTVCIL